MDELQWFKRILAYFLDIFIIIIIYFILIILLLNYIKDGNTFSNIFYYFASYALLPLYEITFLKYNKGQTLGKQLLNLRVVNYETEEGASFGNLIMRSLGRYLCLMTFFIGYLIIFVRKDKRGLHELVSNTKIVNTKIIEDI